LFKKRIETAKKKLITKENKRKEKEEKEKLKEVEDEKKKQLDEEEIKKKKLINNTNNSTHNENIIEEKKENNNIIEEKKNEKESEEVHKFTEEKEETDPSKYTENRKNQIKKLEEEGIDIHPHKFEISIRITEFRKKFGNIENGARLKDIKLSLAGRILTRRTAGKKLIFYTLKGDGEQIQILSDLGNYDGDFYKIHNIIKRGDIVGIIGFPGKSDKGGKKYYYYKIY
jgi:lysyl-tRNA synthetase class 2